MISMSNSIPLLTSYKQHHKLTSLELVTLSKIHVSFITSGFFRAFKPSRILIHL